MFIEVSMHRANNARCHVRNTVNNSDSGDYLLLRGYKARGIICPSKPTEKEVELRKAKGLECFDRFEVAKVETIEVRPDPIIFGLINDCVDKFFITQWDDDVKIEDILKQNEG
jgi:hypothetical protein